MKELRILLVDDDELDRKTVVRTFRECALAGEIIEEPDPNRVMTRLAESTFDCILIDYQLRAMTGFALLKTIRAGGVHTPVLIVTAQEEEFVGEHFDQGATDFLPKADLTPARLARRIDHVVRVGGAENQARIAIAQLESQRALQEAILRQMPVAVIVVDTERSQVMLANHLVNDLLGISLERHAPLTQLGQCVARDSEGNVLTVDSWPIVRVMRDGKAIVGEEITCQRGDGSKAILRVSAAPVHHDDTSRIVAAVMSLEDISAERTVQSDLERMKSTRDEMLAIVSHDLKNPLNAIGVAIEELAEENLDQASRVTYVSAIRRSIRRAHRLIQNLLDVSRIEAGRLKLERISMSPATLLEQARQDSAVLAKDGGIALHVVVASQIPQVLVDRDLMMQVMSNLISNALRYGKSEKGIELSAYSEEEYVVLAVSDSGPGITAASLPHLFDHYWQANRQRRGSAGLGLAIVRGVVHAHGGNVVARNREQGGAEFLVRIPITPPSIEDSAPITLAHSSAT